MAMMITMRIHFLISDIHPHESSGVSSGFDMLDTPALVT